MSKNTFKNLPTLYPFVEILFSLYINRFGALFGILALFHEKNSFNISCV